MRNKLLFLFIFLSFHFTLKATDAVSLPDSIVTIDNVYVYGISEPEKSQQIIDRLRELKDDSLAAEYQIDWAQADLYYNTGKYRLATYYYIRVRGCNELKSDRKRMMGLLSTMLQCYRLNNNMEKTMETAIELLKIAEKDDVKDEIGKAYQFMGEVFSSREDSTQARKYFGMAEQQLKEAGNIPYLYHYYITYANLLMQNGLYKEALTETRKAGEVLDQVATDPDMMLEGYEQFERSRFNAFIAELLAKNGKIEEAEEYYERFKDLHLNNVISNKIVIVPYLLTTERYKEAIKLSKEREEYLRQYTDTIGDDMLAAKSYLATAYKGLGRKDLAIEKLNEQLSIEKQLRSKQVGTTTQELAVIYETEKKDIQLRKSEAEALSQRSLALALSLISILSLSIMVIAIYSYRNTKRNNLLMANKIKELQKLRESQNECFNKDHYEVDLFTRLEMLMRHEKLYRDSTCNRELILSRLNIDKNTLLELQHTNNIESLPDYINGFRLEEAIFLLENSRSLSIAEIAKRAGFGSARSLQRQFKDKNNMTPGEYRKLVQK